MTDERIERVKEALPGRLHHYEADPYAALDSLERELTELREAIHEAIDNADAGGPLDLVARILRAALSHRDEVTR